MSEPRKTGALETICPICGLSFQEAALRIGKDAQLVSDKDDFLNSRALVPNASAYRLDVLAAPDHPLNLIPIPKEILEAAGEIADLSDGGTIERSTLEFLIRFVLFAGSGVAGFR